MSQRTEENLNELVQKLKALFSYYSSFGDRLNATNLKASKFHKMMQDAQVETKASHKKRLDLIFCSQNKNMPNMTFETFLNSLAAVAEFRYPNEKDHGAALNTLLKQDLLPLYDRLYSSQANFQIQDKYEVELNENAIALLKSIEDTLYEVYVTYLPWEQITSDSKETVVNRSVKALFRFLNEFEICPTILNKTVSFNVIMSVIENENEPPTAGIPSASHTGGGTIVTFAKFLHLILKLAYFAYDAAVEGTASTVNYSTAERLCFLLERMELSDGFANLEKKTNRPRTSKTSLLPPDQLVMKVMQEHEDREEVVKESTGEGNIGSDDAEVLEKYGLQLQSLFQKYCSYGDPLNTSKLKSSRFMKILRDCGLVSRYNNIEKQRLRPVDVDLIYTKVTGIKLPLDTFQSSTTSMSMIMSAINASKVIESPSNAPERGPQILDFNKKRVTSSAPSAHSMDFDQFLSALKLIAQKLMPDKDQDQALSKLIEDCILPLYNEKPNERVVTNETLLGLMELLKNKEMAEFMEVVHKSLYPYYKTYCGPKGFMTLDSFIRFCSDFEIFPDITTKPRLSRIFQTVANIYSTEAGVSRSRTVVDPEACIDDNLFVQIIALCALEVPYKEPQPDNFEKVKHVLNIDLVLNRTNESNKRK